LIQLQYEEARMRRDIQVANNLLKVQYFLIAFFAEVMSEFGPYYELSPAMINFGKILYNEKPTIITFNYDLFIESAIEQVNYHKEKTYLMLIQLVLNYMEYQKTLILRKEK
jgi:hypothetical protein